MVAWGVQLSRNTSSKDIIGNISVMPITAHGREASQRIYPK